MATLKELVDGSGLYNRIVSVGTDGLMLVAERVTVDDASSAWKLTKIDENGQFVPNDPPFVEAYTSRQLSTLAEYGNYIDWRAEPIDFKPGHRLVDEEGYKDQMMPKY